MQQPDLNGRVRFTAPGRLVIPTLGFLDLAALLEGVREVRAPVA